MSPSPSLALRIRFAPSNQDFLPASSSGPVPDFCSLLKDETPNLLSFEDHRPISLWILFLLKLHRLPLEFGKVETIFSWSELMEVDEEC